MTLNNVDYTRWWMVPATGVWAFRPRWSVGGGRQLSCQRLGNRQSRKHGHQSLTVTVNTAAPLIGINSIGAMM